MNVIDIQSTLTQAKSGDAQAQNHLANYYLLQDSEEAYQQAAFYWFSRACEQGYAPAKFGLASMLLKREGGAVEQKLALRLMIEAAKSGAIPAIEFMVEAHDQGLYNLMKNEQMGEFWKERLAAQSTQEPSLTGTGVGVEELLKIVLSEPDDEQLFKQLEP